MQIDWLHFTPWSSLFGGALIGLSCAILLLASGHIAGVSGIVGELLRTRGVASGWRLAFVAGLLTAPSAWALLIPGGLPESRLVVGSVGQLLPFAIGGVLVGIGTRLANGCTSGHGICGLARFSRRSLVAVLVFMGTAMAVVFVTRYVIGSGG